MVKFKMMCPTCNAVVVTASPESMVWEICPSCRQYIWDGYDALLADIVPDSANSDMRSIRIQQSN